ncbi:hypothetical protein [Streptomyces capuensis]|uniref:hypothetical protein n=1 Tax=Streptomyces capuensis TaxID=1464056 RepID=UPI00067DA201|nr:hypothetical protein [Streptomyces capuensis]
MPRHPISRRIRLATLLTAVTAAVASLSGWYRAPAMYSGPGWQIETSAGIYSLAPDEYTIVFADATARTKLTPYLTGPAAQIQAATGVPVTVSSTLDATPASACPSRHRIVVHYTYRPLGTAGYSQALPCYNTVDGSAWGGHVLMDSEYWTATNWFSSNATVNEAMRKNAVTHELGHIVGLDHPNTDLDGDGAVEPYECVTDSGVRPVMCSPNGGYTTVSGGGRYTDADLNGLRQLAANYGR